MCYMANMSLAISLGGGADAWKSTLATGLKYYFPL